MNHSVSELQLDFFYSDLSKWSYSQSDLNHRFHVLDVGMGVNFR